MTEGFIVIAVLGCLSAIAGYAALHLHGKARRARVTLEKMGKTPTSRVADAEPTGTVELAGVALPVDANRVLEAPLSGMKCLWWRVEIEEVNGSSVTKIATKTDAVDFLLDDGSGSVARVRTSDAKVAITARTIDPTHEDRARRFLAALGVNKTVEKLFWSEERIDPQAEVYVLGQARALDAAPRAAFRDGARERFVVVAPSDGELILSVSTEAALATKLRAENAECSRLSRIFGGVAALFVVLTFAALATSLLE